MGPRYRQGGTGAGSCSIQWQAVAGMLDDCVFEARLAPRL